MPASPSTTRPRWPVAAPIPWLAVLVAATACGSGRTRAADPVEAPELSATGRPCPAPGAPTPITTTAPPDDRGGSCPEGVCPEYHACGCDAAGRLRFREHVTSGLARERTWIDRDADGRPVEVTVDHEADARLDTRSALSRNGDGSCMVEARDDDLDGTVETLCTYDHDCLVGQPQCSPRSCVDALPRPRGRWCEPASCPGGSRCACDEAGRVVQILSSSDGDAAFELATELDYHAADRVAERRYLRHGVLTDRESFTYDARGRKVGRTFDAGADGTLDAAEAWTFGEGDDEWTSFEEWRGGALATRKTRSYRDGQPLSETFADAWGNRSTTRFLPGADDDVIQPIVVSSGLLTLEQVSCQRDADCVVVPASCCDCSSGGAGAVINRRFARRFAAAVTRGCTARPTCLAVISDAPTCRGDLTPACVQDLCTLRRTR